MVKPPELKKYYLYQNGKMVGPISQVKFDALKQNGEILHYSWYMDSVDQKWHSVDPKPEENPFTRTQESIGNRELTGTILSKINAFSGKILGMHSFGLEILLPHVQARRLGFKADEKVPLNLVDLANNEYMHVEGVFQSAEAQEGGLLVRLAWAEAPAQF